MRRRGFTLVELLVVVGIVALLIGLLFPALTKAREHAQRLRCATNLHSMGQAMHVYVAQTGHYPLGDPHPWAGLAAVWVARLWVLMDGNFEQFNCPFRSDRYGWDGTNRAEWTLDGEPIFRTFGGSRPFSYAYNLGGTDNQEFERGIGGTLRGGRYVPLRSTSVRCPADMIAIADGPDTKEPPFVTDCFALAQRDGGVSLRIYAPRGAHRGGYMNVLFCDGHVEHLHRKQVLAGTWALRRWNRDSNP
jgi:prepilin-type processing-associated H-X9-DG protein/prepilin-type N-terminal cleavage/methylation domain-containing protein